MNPAVIKTLLATVGITDPNLCEFVSVLIANSEGVKSEMVGKHIVCNAVDHSSDATCLQISGTVKGKPMLAFLVITN